MPKPLSKSKPTPDPAPAFSHIMRTDRDLDALFCFLRDHHIRSATGPTWAVPMRLTLEACGPDEEDD